MRPTTACGDSSVASGAAGRAVARSSALALALLAALTLAAYHAVGRLPFAYDDLNWLPLRSVGWSAGTLAWGPWVALGWVGHFRPAIYHAGALAVHLVNGLLFFAILRRWLTDAGALVATGLFWLHPLNSEAVAYATGSIEAVVTLWALGAIWCGLQDRRIWWPLAALCLAGAVLTKWSALPLLVAVPAVWGCARRRPTRLLWALPFAAWLLLPAVSFWHDELIGLHVPLTAHLTFAAQTGLALAWYLTRVVWPVHLTLLHNWAAYGLPVTTMACVALAFTALAAWPLRRRVPILLYAVGWIALLIGPRALIPQGQLLTMHHCYLPFLAVWACLGWLAGGERKDRYGEHHHAA